MQVMPQQNKQQQEQMQNFQKMFTLVQRQQSQIIIKLLEKQTESWPDFVLCKMIVVFSDFRHMFLDFFCALAFILLLGFPFHISFMFRLSDSNKLD